MTAIVNGKSATVRAGYSDWQSYVKGAIRNVRQLCEVLGLKASIAIPIAGFDDSFGLFVPEPYLRRIEPENPLDPLLLQVLPQSVEHQQVNGFRRDAVGDQQAQLSPGVMRKYAGRALLVVSGACAIHCRYCFRRHYPYNNLPISTADWQIALQAVKADPTITEVILSGGDPLMIVDEKLAELVATIESIEHVKRLRIHTRLPIVIPQRINSDVVEILSRTHLCSTVVVHANHPRELDADVYAALGRLIDCGIPVLNQSVLLKQVNDDLETLVALSERLIDARCLPYYLHQLDRVSGAAHFEVPIAVGCALVRQMRNRLPGYAVPRYVQEVQGELSKKVLA